MNSSVNLIPDITVSLLPELPSKVATNLGAIQTPNWGEARRKSGNALYGAYGQDFICADGQRVMVIGLTDRQWAGLVKVTETEVPMAALAKETGMNLRDEGVRWTLRDRITAILTPWFAARPVTAFANTFDRSGVTWFIFRDFAEALKHDPDLSTDNPMFEDVLQPGLGTVMTPKSPVSFSGANTHAAQPEPVLGTDTEEILGDVVGLCNTEIAQLFDQGIVESPTYSAHRATG